MTAVIQIKRSQTAAAQPASLAYGELGINITDKKIYIGNSSGATTLLVDGNATGGGVSSFNTRTGAITLTSSDVTTALGFTPISSSSNTEVIQDAAASLFTSGTHVGISVSYPDTNNAINLTNTGVLSFNSRTGSVSLTSSDVTTALGYTPQRQEPTLTAIANLSPDADDLIYFSGTDGAAITTLTSFGRSLIDDLNASAARTTLGLAIGTNVQAWDADLDAIAALSGTSGVLKKTAANTWSLDTDTYWKNTNDGDNSGLDADLLHGVDGDRVIEEIQTGLLYGGVITINGSDNTKVDISAGAGVISTVNASLIAYPAPTLQTVTWTAKTGVSVTGLATGDFTWLRIDSSGNVQQSTSDFTQTQYLNSIVLGNVVHPNRTSIVRVHSHPIVAYASSAQYETFIRYFGPLKISGLQLSSYLTSGQIQVSSGSIFALGANMINDADNPSLVTESSTVPANTLYYLYRNLDGTYKTDPTVKTSVDFGNWDDGSGTLASMSSATNKWTIQRIYKIPGENVFYVYYGTIQYNSDTVALNNIYIEPITEADISRVNGVFIGYMIVRGGGSNMATTNDAHIVQAGFFRNTTGGGGAITTANLDDLADVTITSPAANQLLYYNSGSSLWVNASASTIGLATLTGSETLTNKTLTSPTINSPTISNLYLSDGLILVEGTTNDSNEMSLVVDTLTADRTITFPDASGTLITSGDTATVTNTMLAGSIAYSKLNLTGAILNADLAGSIAYSKLSLSNSIVNTDISSSAAIANSKLANSSITVNGSSISLGGSATVTANTTNSLSFSTGLTAASSFNGSSAVSVSVDTSTIATRSYVDLVAQGLHAHATADTATTAKLATLTGTTVSYSSGAITWTGGTAATAAGFNDGITLTANTTESSASKILVKNESDAGGLGSSKNGTYYVYGTRELRRTSDGDAAVDWKGGDFCFVTQGTSYNNTGWVQTEVITTLDTDPILWEQFSGAGTYTADETTLTKSGSVFSIKSTYTGQTSITTLGTIGTGTWNATTIGTTKGGTGLTSFTSGGLLYASSTSALTTGSVFSITNSSSGNSAYRINIVSGATPKTTQEFKVSETAFNSSAAIGVYTDVNDNPPGSLGQAYINLISTTGTDSQIVLTSGSGSVTFSGGTTPLSLTSTPSLWGNPVGVLYCIDHATNPYIIFGDDGSFNGTNIKITDTSSTMIVTAATLKINTSTPSAGEVLTCTASDGTCVWQEVTGATLALYNMGLI